MKFTAKRVNTNGLSLQAYVGVCMETLCERFPQGRMPAYDDEEKGYTDPYELGFVDEDGNVYYVYSRWGSPRVGALSCNRNLAEELAIWLQNNNR